MSKPWEQEWESNGLGHIQATDAIQIEVKTAFWRVAGGEKEAVRQVEEVQRFLLASQDMARALMGFLGACCRTGNPVRVCIEDRSVRTCPTCAALMALRKAGVLE